MPNNKIDGDEENPIDTPKEEEDGEVLPLPTEDEEVSEEDADEEDEEETEASSDLF